MKVRSKKLLSAAVVSAILAAQTLMPVAAAGSELDVQVTTRTAPIRVTVPTAMEIAVDQFMLGGAGSQISSDAFTMSNKSQIPVKVTVTSTAELGAKTKLVSTKKAAEDSTDKTSNEAWIAAVTQTSAGNYTETAVDSSQDVDALTGTEKNITAFRQGTGADAAKGTAVQTFYLDKGTAPKNKLFKATTSSKEEVKVLSYAQFYELTPESDPGSQAALQALVDAGDVYYVATSAIADAVDLTKISKGATVGASDYANTNTYYTVATTETDTSAMLADATKVYVYGDGTAASAGGDAAFRYIGALSSAKDSWDSTDLQKVHIKYDITGISVDNYNEIKDDLKYGYKVETSPISLSDGVLTIKGISLNDMENITFTVDDAEVVLSAKNGSWNAADAADAVFTFNDSWKEGLKGTTCVITVNDTITATIEVPAA